MLKFFSGFVILILALFLQFLLASAGIHLNLALATLIAFAFIFDLWELLFFDLLAVFLLNWEPALSLPLLAFALIPLLAFAFRKLIRTELWIGNLAAILGGFLIFYLASAPASFVSNFLQFVIDLIVGLSAGELVLFALK
jgi:hypothetical protein